MSNILIKTRLPVKDYDGQKLAMVIGTPLLELGQTVNVRDLSLMFTHRDLVILDVMVTPILDTPKFVLETFGYPTFTDLRHALAMVANVSLPAESFISVIVLGNKEEWEDPIAPLVEEEEEDTEIEWDDFPADEDADVEDDD